MLVVWLSILIAAIGAAAAVAGAVRSYRPPKYRLSWRVHLDNRVGLTPREELAGVAELGVRLKRDDGVLVDMPEAGVVLLRVRADGREGIPASKFDEPIRFRFGNRRVVGVQVKNVGNNDPNNDPFLDDFLGPKTSDRQDSRRAPRHAQEVLSFPNGEYLQLPRMALRRDTHIRMLVLLDGGGERIVTAEGSIAGGELVQDTVRLGAPSKTATRTLVLAIGAAFLALIVAVIVITTTPSPVPIPGVECVAGTLSVSGSTAFEPTNQDLAVRYHTSCPRSTITSHANGSFGGVLDLAIRGRGDPSVRNTSLASSDGPVQGFGGLDRQPLAVVIFSVVVNSADGVYSLTRDELAGIYAGRITNWSELHGPNLPIRVVSRGADSGTRNTFDQKVLGTQPEPPANSHNCVDPDPALPASRVIRCETQSTEEVLQQVNAIPGAIGYAEMSTTSTTYPQLHQIQIAGYDPSPASVKNGAYPFWTVEYFYSYSQPDPGSLAAAFLEFIGTDTAKNIMQQNGHIPCTDPDAQEHKLCQ